MHKSGSKQWEKDIRALNEQITKILSACGNMKDLQQLQVKYMGQKSEVELYKLQKAAVAKLLTERGADPTAVNAVGRMPAAMLKDLTPAQKKQMLEMTQRQNILERATKLAGVDAAYSTELKDAGVYSWRDASDHVYLEVSCGDDAKDVQCKIELDSIEISHGDNNTILKGTLFQNVLPKESKWELLGDGKLAITLKKVSSMRWLLVLR